MVTDAIHLRTIALDVPDGPRNRMVQWRRSVVKVNVVDITLVVVGIIRVSVGLVKAVSIRPLLRGVVYVVRRVGVVVQNRFWILASREAEVLTVVTLIGLLRFEELIAVWTLSILGIGIKELNFALFVCPLVEDINVTDLILLSWKSNGSLTIFDVINIDKDIISGSSNCVLITWTNGITINGYKMEILEVRYINTLLSTRISISCLHCGHRCTSIDVNILDI